MSGVLKATGLLAVNSLCQGTMEKRILHIKLVNRPSLGESQGEHSANRRRFDNWAESFREVNTGALYESPKNLERLVPFQSAISGELVLEDPLSGDNIGLAGTRHQVPSVILQ
jgi:hypothetical protein